jgi:hypothetical protein
MSHPSLLLVIFPVQITCALLYIAELGISCQASDKEVKAEAGASPRHFDSFLPHHLSVSLRTITTSLNPTFEKTVLWPTVAKKLIDSVD